MIKDNKAVTTTMLTVVVIVLSIIVGVTVSISVNRGLINIGNKSAEDFDVSSIKQMIDSIYLSERNKYNSGLITKEDMFNNIKQGIKTNIDLTSNINIIGEKNNLLIKIKDNKFIMGIDTFEEIKTISAGEYTGSTTKIYVDSEGKTAYIPAGFTVSDVKDTENNIDETTIRSGLVIYEGNQENVSDLTTIKNEVNQFVWIPVNNISSMAVEKTGIDATGRQNYKGVLYDWVTDVTGNTIYTAGYNEPYNLGSNYTLDTDTTVGDTTIVAGSYAYDSQEMFTLFGGGTYASTMYQEEFNKMVESVKEYKGFYVGRYETSKNSNSVAQSKSQVSTTVAYPSGGWYGLYALNKTYNNKEKTLNSSMMWGCQYDTMLKWMLSNNIAVSELEPVDGAIRNTTGTTGNTESDKLNNIYDVIGCRSEWTKEAGWSNSRMKRGGSTSYNEPPTSRNSQRHIC